MSEDYYRVGQAGGRLGISSYKVRQLSQAGLINAEFTGSQWRIPIKEVDRLLRDGIPPIPKSFGDDATSESITNKPNKPSTLLAPPSPAVIQSSEKVVEARNQVEIRKAERELFEQDDYLDARKKKREQELAAEQARSKEEQGRIYRQRWTAEWIGWVLNDRLPWIASSAPEHYRLLIRNEAEKVLASLPTNSPQPTVICLLEVAIEKALRPWRREQDRNKALEEGKSQLPYGARGNWGKPSAWEIRYRRVATQNLADLEDCTYEDMLSICTEASRQVSSEYEHSMLCQKVVNEVQLEKLTAEELQDAKDIALTVLNHTQPGTSKQRLQLIRDEALSPYHQINEKRKQVEAHHALCKKLVEGVYWDFGYTAPTFDRGRAQKELKEALAGLSVPATEAEIKRVRNSVFERIKSEIAAKEKAEQVKKVEEERSRKEKEEVQREKDRIVARERQAEFTITLRSSTIRDYLRELQDEGDFDFEDFYKLADEIEEELSPALKEELMKKDMTYEEVTEYIQSFIDDWIL